MTSCFIYLLKKTHQTKISCMAGFSVLFLLFSFLPKQNNIFHILVIWNHICVSVKNQNFIIQFIFIRKESSVDFVLRFFVSLTYLFVLKINLKIILFSFFGE